MPRYNIAPTQPILAVWEESGHRMAKLARWGLVPNWVKDPRDFPLIINARAETMAEKPAFRDALKHQRCVVPASGYYEWRTDAQGRKRPHYITMRDGKPMIMAGLYATWIGPEGEEIDSLALLTVPANSDLAHIHHRMPALIEGEEVSQWLDVRNTPIKEAASLIRTAEPDTVSAYQVSTRVNSAHTDGPDLIELIADEPEEDAPAPRKNDQLDLF